MSTLFPEIMQKVARELTDAERKKAKRVQAWGSTPIPFAGVAAAEKGTRARTLGGAALGGLGGALAGSAAGTAAGAAFSAVRGRKRNVRALLRQRKRVRRTEELVDKHFGEDGMGKHIRRQFLSQGTAANKAGGFSSLPGALAGAGYGARRGYENAIHNDKKKK